MYLLGGDFLNFENSLSPQSRTFRGQPVIIIIRDESKYRGLKGAGGGGSEGRDEEEGERGETENQTFPLRRISSRSLLPQSRGTAGRRLSRCLYFYSAGKNYNKSEIEAESVHGLKIERGEGERESVEKKKGAWPLTSAESRQCDKNSRVAIPESCIQRCVRIILRHCLHT